MIPVLTLALFGAQTFDLRIRPTAKPVVLNAVEDRVDGKEHVVLGTRFEITVASNLSASLKLGPYTAKGRTFGRPKTREIRLTSQGTLQGDGAARPPFLLSVPLPGRPVKVGDIWNASITGPTPMPAGVKATFRTIGAAKVAGVPCVRIKVKLDTEMSGARITGGGEMAVRQSDGLVQSGNLNVLLVYRRPDPVTKKVTENARVTVKSSIKRA